MIPLKLSEKKLEKVINAYIDLIDSITDEEIKLGLHCMLESIGERLFTTPASNKLEYHNCFIGGLVEHSLRVYENLRKLCKEFAPDISYDSIVLVALTHDLGKIGTIDDPYYIDQDNDWRKNTLGEYYKFNPKLLYLDVSVRNIHLLTQFGIKLSEEEFQAIIISDGQYVPSNKNYAQNECWLGLLLHQADMIACKTETEKWKSFQ